MNLSVNINGKSATVKTDNYGQFIYTRKTNQTGTNKVTVTFKGNTKYKESTTEKTFKVIPKTSKITINPILDTEYTDTVTITGQLTDTDNNIIRNYPLTMTLNQVKTTTNTDKYGKFKFTSKTSIIGKNTVRITSTATDKYSKTTSERTFKVTPQTTKITINNIANTQYTDKVIITGKLTDKNNVKLENRYLYININGKTTTIQTDYDGLFKHTRKTNKTGTNTVTVSYIGSTKYKESTAEKTFKVIPKTSKITINPIEKTRYTENVTIAGKYTDKDSVAITNTKITLKLNGIQRTVKTDKNGLFTFTVKTNIIGKNTLNISTTGNSKYAKAQVTKTFTVTPQITKITVNKIAETEYTDNVTIKGTLKDKNNKALKAKVIIKINGINKTVNTNDKGIYTFSTKTTQAGKNTVTVTFDGNKNYTKTSYKTSFTVTPKTTKITINNIKKTTYKNNVSISGKLTDSNNKKLNNTQVVLKVNGIAKTLKTNSKGIFNYSIKTNKVGTNNVTVSFTGNNKYKSVATSKTFIVNKIATKITINNINNTQYANTVKITGKLSENNNKIIKNTNLTVKINGKAYTTRTNNKGIYTLNYKTNTVGKNYVTISYMGNNQYQSTSKSTTFKVTKKDTKITVTPIEQVEYLTYPQITGKFMDSNGNALCNMTLSVNVDGKKYTTKTNNLGEYVLYHKSTKIGTNNITISYDGNAYYNTAKTKISYIVTKIGTKIRLYDLDSCQYGDVIYISGHFTDMDSSPLRYSTINVNVNGAKYSTQTNNMGDFKFQYKTSKVGLNNVTVSFGGNSQYLGTSTTKKFYVTTKDTEIILEEINDLEVVNGYETIWGKLIDIDENSLKYTPLTVNVDGRVYATQTNNYGEFSFKFKPNLEDFTVLTVSYAGNDKYTGTVTTAKEGYFDTEIFLDDIEDAVLGDRIVIKGYLEDVLRGYHLQRLPLTLTINGKNYATQIDTNGDFNFYYTTTKTGINTLSVSFAGANIYTKSTKKTTFIVKEIPTTILVSSTIKSSDGKSITIKGIFHDVKGNMLKYTPLTLKVDGTTYTTQTDGNGYYTCNIKNNNNKIHTLSISYAGNSKYAYTQTSITFVAQNSNKIELLIEDGAEGSNLPNQEMPAESYKRIGTDEFYTTSYYQDIEGYHKAGIYVGIFGLGSYPSTDANQITSATFYFKNKNDGSIITVKGKASKFNTYMTEFKNGYIVSKVVATYRISTQQEIREICETIKP